jgi:RNA polymerase sigma-70 factor, ECF subfamily
MDEYLSAQLEAYIEQLMLLYGDQVYAYALHLTRHTQDAEDIALEAFMRTYSYLRSKPDRRILQPKSWLFTTARNCYLNSRRGKGSLSTESLDLLLSPMVTEQDTSPLSIADHTLHSQPDVVIERKEALQEVGTQIAALPEGVIRDATALNILGELSCPEIAKQLHRPLGTIKASVYHGKVELRARLISWKNEGKPSYEL